MSLLSDPGQELRATSQQRIHIHVCVYIYTYTYLFIFLFIRVYIYIYVYVCVYMYAYMCVTPVIWLARGAAAGGGALSGTTGAAALEGASCTGYADVTLNPKP